MTDTEKQIIKTMEGFANNIAGLTGSIAAITYLIAKKMENLSDSDREMLSTQSHNLLELEKQIASVAPVLKDIREGSL